MSVSCYKSRKQGHSFDGPTPYTTTLGSISETMLETKKKPARLQVDPETVQSDEKPEQTGTVFNVWYAKWSGGDTSSNIQTAAKFRCSIERDQGYTKAREEERPYFCLYFARGMCCNGRKCEFLHRLPTEFDAFPPSVDCFGREKFSDYRDDMGGVGSFHKINRTLYFGRLNTPDDVESKLTANCQEWGALESSRVLRDRHIAFVTYKNELNAQFAKEAMAHQRLDADNDNEVLEVRWARDDPDPRAQKRQREKMDEYALETVQKLLTRLEEQGETPTSTTEVFQEPKPPAEKRQKMLISQNPLIDSATLETLKSVDFSKINKPKTVIAGYESSDEE